jgi:peptidoglycan/LPS O-acetylase OafA/YrhL
VRCRSISFSPSGRRLASVPLEKSSSVNQEVAPLQRVPGLDLLRLVAALLVVLYHYTFHGPGAYDLTWLSVPEVSSVTRYFNLGVPLFFAISGFVIAASVEGRTVREFFIARASRLYPAFLVCMTLTFVVVTCFGAPRLTTSAAQWVANLLIAAPALNQEYMDLVYWSIVCEVIFYAMVAGTAWLGLFQRHLPFLVVGWLVVSVVNEVLLKSNLVRHLLITNYSGYFSAGMMIYCLVRGQPRKPLIWGLLIAATIVGAFQADWNANWLRERGVELLPAVVMLLGALTPLMVGAFVLIKRLPVGPGTLLALGGLTYPLYLMHQMIGYVIFNHLEGVAPRAVLLVGVIATMLAASWIVYRFIERPAQARLRGLLRSLLIREKRQATPSHGQVEPMPRSAIVMPLLLLPRERPPAPSQSNQAKRAS